MGTFRKQPTREILSIDATGSRAFGERVSTVESHFNRRYTRFTVKLKGAAYGIAARVSISLAQIHPSRGTRSDLDDELRFHLEMKGRAATANAE